MITRLIVQIGAGILGLWLAIKYVSGVEFAGSFEELLLAGTILGLINFFIKPILKFITLPLRIITLGLFSLVINMGTIWAVDILFQNLIIIGLISLFWTTAIIWGLSSFLGVYWAEKK